MSKMVIMLNLGKGMRVFKKLFSLQQKLTQYCKSNIVQFLKRYGGGGIITKSCPTLGIPWTVAHQAPLSRGFPRQEYWSGVPCPPLRDLPNPGIEPASPTFQVDSLPLSHQGIIFKRYICI